jgi:hypothetical protein
LLSQGVLDTLQLAALTREGGLLEDPELLRLADPTQVFYVGVSLGSIEGAVVERDRPVVPRAVFHVAAAPGRRCSSAPATGPCSRISSSPACRRRGTASSATRCRSSTGIRWTPRTTSPSCDEQPLLWQEAIGDDQVPNLTTETLMRGVGATLLEPSVSVPIGIVSSAAPTHPRGVSSTPELGIPPTSTGRLRRRAAHGVPREWEGTKEQVLRFLDPEIRGRRALLREGPVQCFESRGVSDRSPAAVPPRTTRRSTVTS